MLHRVPLALLSALAFGCFSPEAPLESEGATDSGDAGTEAGTTGGTQGVSTESSGPEDSTGTDATSMENSETDTSDPTIGGDAPPVIDSFEVNGSTTPEDVTRSSMVLLTAVVTDDVGVASVDFYDGDRLLGTVTEEPFELETLVTSVESGGHVFHAVGTDTAAQNTESDEVQLFIDVSGGELLDINEGLFQGCVYFAAFGGIAAIRDDRFVLSGTGCSDSAGGLPAPPTILAFDDDLDVLSEIQVDATFAMPPTTLDDGRALVPTVDFLAPSWSYHVFDPQLGDIDPGAGLFYAQSSPDTVPAAVSIPGEGVFVVRGQDDAAFLEPDLDTATWTSDLGVGAGGSAAVRARAVGGDGSVFVFLDTTDCPGAAEQCLVKLRSDGTRDWTRAVQDPPYFGALAPDAEDGVFYALRTPTGFGYLVVHLNSDGDEVSSELLTSGSPPSAFPRIAPDGHGGVVLAGAYGDQDPNSAGEVSNDESFLLRLDESLEEAWRVEGLGPGQSRAVALAPDGTGSLLVVGIHATTEPPTVFGTEGAVWLGRVNL